MSEQEHPNPDDLLERSVAALRNQQLPPGPSPRIVTDTLLALRGAGEPLNFWQRVIVMIQTHKIAASVAVAISGLGIYLAVIFFAGFASISYAQVAEQLRAIQSMSCTMTEKAADSSKPVSMREMFMSPGKVRTEMPNGNFMITDSQAHKTMLLDRQKRTAMIFEFSPTTSPTTRPAGTNGNLIEFFKNLANDKAQPLGDRQIGSVNTKGFRTENQGFDVTIYADAKTGLPVEVDFDRPIDSIHIKFTDFDFDAKLDPNLFSLEPPAGYTVQNNNMTQVTYDLGKNLVPMLRAYADHAEGKFPPDLDDTLGILRTATGKPLNSDKPDAAALQLMTNIFQMRALLRQYHKGKDWDYFPDGAKLGDGEKIILWYQPQGATTYKAIYGDLRIADVTVGQLPKAGAPSGGL
jgi:outer membrane lipoprotein-sorting protein